MRRLKQAPRRRGLMDRPGRIGLFIVTTAVISAGIHAGIRLDRPPGIAAIGRRAEDRLIAATASLGFTVSDVAVVGRHRTDPVNILKSLKVRRGTPILAVNLSRAEARLDALPWVHSARVERLFPGTIFVRLSERRPLALWQHDEKIQLIDRTGAVIPVGNLGRFAKLPLVVGADAASHARALLHLLAQQPVLAAHVTAAVWVGDRRWNLHLDNGIAVLLPTDEPAAAWAELARLQRKDAILQRDIKTIDMRLPDRLVLRIAAPQPPDNAGKKGRPLAKST
jgi:cell division protein FtsQ